MKTLSRLGRLISLSSFPSWGNAETKVLTGRRKLRIKVFEETKPFIRAIEATMDGPEKHFMSMTYRATIRDFDKKSFEFGVLETLKDS